MTPPATWNVLLVEDNPGDVSLVRTCVEIFLGVTLSHVPNAIQASRFITRESPFEDVSAPDLILLDLRMPMFDGSDVLRDMRESALAVKTTVVVLTSSTLPCDELRCRELGATDFVNKPVDWNSWRVTIHRIFRKHLKGFSE